MSGKGSSPRPFSVSQEEYANRWDAIFGRDIKEDQKTKDDEKALDEAFDQIETQQKLNSK
jgi:hypothetical protein